MTDLAALARRQLDRHRFLVLGTVDPSGRARVSPVWFSVADHATVYWLSSPDAHHSRNIERNAEVSLVVHDSAGPPETGAAVYLEATAERVPAADLAAACAEAFAGADERVSFTPESLAAEPFVLYRARITAVEVHVRGNDPEHGTGIDRREPVRLI